jgi:hypothetical protein
MATVVALDTFVGILENDELGEDRVEQHSEHPGAPSVFPGGKFYPAGYINAWGRDVGGKPQGAGSLVVNVKKPGRKVDIRQGQRYDANHPAVKKWPDKFGEVGLHPEVESATRAPGEKRGT